MYKGQLIEKIAEITGTEVQQAEKFVNAFAKIVSDELIAGGHVQVTGFGHFKTVQKVERVGRNPTTGEKIIIPAHKSPIFRAGYKLKNAIKENK